ncbi:MAG: molecular chaperone DnaJ [Candidatus Omnitrophica bacterium]|nr:molecular chaperone DnaJ [Candidatus Omnitrophota bacterium]
MKRDYYEILGVDKKADLQDIKKAYRSMALKFHPDRVPEAEKKEAEEKFKEISEAYGVLSDPKKRQLYDQHGHAGIDQNFTADDIFRGADFSSIFEEAGLGDILNQFFGGGGGGGFDFFSEGAGGRSSRRAQRGRDIQYEMEISLEDAFHGAKRKISVPRNEFCSVCNGTGAKNASALKNCTTCGGRGQVVMSNGFFRMAQTCHQCHGAGKVITEYCPKCSGRGAVKIMRNIDVSIPAGVDNSSRLRVRHEGEVGRDGNGDLYLYIHVLPHNTFERNGDDIALELPVSFVVAALGGEVSVPTLGGPVSMKIPSGTQSGRVFRLKDKGMPNVHGGATGDQYAKVMVQVPKSLTTEQKKLLEEFARVSGENISGSSESIKEKIKKVFK